ncbi:MAG TPA: diguanylate cyclase, partial [Duganella sp.]|nr:diguanylate cyclase [Duganella sp.]
MPNDIAHWRERIFARLLLIVFLLGLATAVPSMLLAASEGMWSIVVIDVVALSWLGAILLLRRVAYTIRVVNFLAVAFVVGVGLLLKIGPVSQIYLMAVPVLAALLLGLRPAIWTLLLAGLAVMVLGFEENAKVQIEGMPDHAFLKSAIISINFMFMTAVLTLSCAVLLQQLARSFDELRASADSLERLAFFDVLTGLPNRRLLMDRVGTLLASSARSATFSAVMFIDLDRFKTINDARGHAIGDALLRKAADRLSQLVRKADTVARIGGDDFVVVLAHLGDDLESATRAARTVADKVRIDIGREFEIEGQFYTSTASIGVTMLPKSRQGTQQQNAHDLLREADTAMYRAKAEGRNGIAFFEAAMQTAVEQRLSMERDLAAALAAGELQMHVQPQVDRGGRA